MRGLILAMVLTLSSVTVRAQEPATTNAGRLRAAIARLRDLDYAGAEAMARAVIADPHASRTEMKRALAYLGIALWPEDTLDSPRRPATVDSAFQKLVELDPDAMLPDSVASWDGPKQRLEEIRRRTLAGRLRFDGPLLALGPFDSVAIRYRATRPARARIELTGPGITLPVIVESTTLDTGGTLAIRVNGPDQPLYTTGEYALALMLRDRADATVYSRRYVVAIETVGADYLAVNPPGDPPDLLPVTAPPRRSRTIVGALLLGGATVALATTFRADGRARDLASANPQGVAVAGGLALGGLLASIRAAPRELPENIRYNIERRDEWSLERDRQVLENQRRRDGMRTRLRIIEEITE